MIWKGYKQRINSLFSNSFWNRLFRNVFSAFVGESGSAMLTVITTMIMIRAIGDTGYGSFVLAQSYMTIVDGLINFQSWQAVIKYGSECIENNNFQSLAAIIKVGMIVDLITAIAGTIVAVAICPLVASLMNWGRELQICIIIFCLEIVFHFSGASVGVLRLFNRFNLVATQKVVVAAIKLVAVLGFWILGCSNLVVLVVAYVMADIVGHLLLTGMCFTILHRSEKLGVKMVLFADVKGYRKKFWNFAFWTNVTSSIDIPVKQLDVFILSTISYEMVAVYKVYKQIGNILVQLSVPISQAIMPQFSELIAKGRSRECYDIMIKLRKGILCVMIPVAIGVTIISPWALKVFFGELYAKYFYILSLYLFSRSFALSYTSIHQLFVSMGCVRENFFYTVIANVVYMILALILTHYFGILGMVISLFGEYFTVITLKKKAICKKLKIN